MTNSAGSNATAGTNSNAGSNSFTPPSAPRDDGSCSYRPVVARDGQHTRGSLLLLVALAVTGLFSRRKVALSDM